MFYEEAKPFIIVVPYGRSCVDYTNLSFDKAYSFYEFGKELRNDLIPYIDKNFATYAEYDENGYDLTAARDHRAMAGLSMGGSGTLVYALNHPEKFAAAAVLSCCPFEHGFSNGKEMDARSAGMVENRGGMEAYLESYENTWGLIDKLCGDPKLPKLYFTIGKDDFLYENYLHFKKHAQEIGLDAKFEEFDGYKHEWRFWDMTIQRALTFFGLDQTDAGNPF